MAEQKRITVVAKLLSGKSKTAELLPDANKSLLDLLEENNIEYPFGCRSGTCGACRVRINQGLHLLESAGPIEEDTLLRCGHGPEIRLGCRVGLKISSPKEELLLDIEPFEDS